MSALSPTLVAWGVEALIASTLLMALVMALRAPVRRLFGAQVAYALWALPLFRLMLPPLPESWREVAATPITRASETITTIILPANTAATAAPVAAAVPALSVAAIVAILWVGGAAAFLLWHLLRHALFCRRIRGAAVAVDRVDGIAIIESEAAPGPLAFGIVRPCVAFPVDFADRYDADERALALAHELGHHARGDLVANWVALVVLALHWFDPIAWRAFHAFRADQEMANDARVLAGRPVWERHAYACAIVKAAHGGTLSAACHLHSVRDLKGRLKMLTTARASRRRLAGGAVSIAALAAIGLALTASGTRATAAIAETVSDTIGVDLPRTVAVVAPTVPEIADVPQAGAVPPMPPVPAVDPVAVPALPESDHAAATDEDHPHGAFRRLRDMPQVSSTNCDREGAALVGDSMVVHKVSEGRRSIVICTDRIARSAESAAQAQVDARKIRREAVADATAALASARAAVASASRHMTDEDRREALADIDAAEAEMRAEIAASVNDR